MMSCDVSYPAITKQPEMHRSLVDPFGERDPSSCKATCGCANRNEAEDLGVIVAADLNADVCAPVFLSEIGFRAAHTRHMLRLNNKKKTSRHPNPGERLDPHNQPKLRILHQVQHCQLAGPQWKT